MKKTLIISPSGNLYGSENVLLDFLSATQNKYTIFVKNKSLLYHKIKDFTPHIAVAFSNEKKLYLKLFFILLTKKSIRNVYVNEGGHIKYIKLLAKIFRKHKFFVHLRILEDCKAERLGVLPKNVQLLTISDFMYQALKDKYPDCIKIYDPYTLSNKNTDIKKTVNTFFNIGIIGRVTKTKGLEAIFEILKNLPKNTSKKIVFNFIGDFIQSDTWFINFKEKISKFTESVINFNDFVADKNTIYKNQDLIIHLNTVEALGRIVFEAIDYNTPILTFNQGGTGELMKLLKLNRFSITKSGNWGANFANKIIEVLEEKTYNKQLNLTKKIIESDFKPAIYSNKIEEILHK